MASRRDKDQAGGVECIGPHLRKERKVGPPADFSWSMSDQALPGQWKMGLLAVVIDEIELVTFRRNSHR